MAVELTVVGSINLDFVARTERLPRAGETVTGASFETVDVAGSAKTSGAIVRSTITFSTCRLTS